jgi:asparagine synthase (glutamine-hydrolysing)
MALPPNLKVRDGVGKYVLKKAVDGILPSEIVYRPKQGFGAPVAEWFRGDFGLRAQQQIKGSALAERGLLDYDTLDGLWASHRKGANWGMHLWNVLNVSGWYDYWIAGRSPA